MILRPLMHLSRFPIAVLAATLSMALLAACGQKGELYLRDKPPAGLKVPKPATPKPVPYPVEPEQQD